ncbi:MAG: AmmeMemoRadiSam system protein B [Anaerolineales bacterium]
MTTTDIRPSPLAGQWYPADPEVLADSIDGYLSQADLPEIPGEILAVVTPHAGHRYSGPVAGYAFAALQGLKPELVVITSPMHQPYSEPILTSGHDAYHTPLGDVPVDHEALAFVKQAFQEKSGVDISSVKNDTEHSVEIELPFLQRVIPTAFTLLPLMIRDQDQGLMRNLSEALGELLASREGLLVASTDLSHFYSAEKARQLDQTIIDAILDLDPEAIYEAERKKEGFACGKGGLAAVIWAGKQLGANQAHHLKHGHSGEVTGDNARVVGYEAAVLTKD